jgi:hypothetical protein
VGLQYGPIKKPAAMARSQTPDPDVARPIARLAKREGL